MFFGFERHTRRAVNCLDRKLESDVARQSDLDTAVGQRFHKEKRISRTAAAKTGHCIQISFLDQHADTEAIENRADVLQICGSRVRAGGIPRGSGANNAGDVRHHPDDTRARLEMRFNARQRNTRGDRNKKFRFTELLGKLTDYRYNDLRLDGENNDVGKITELAIVRRHLNTDLSIDRLPEWIAHVARHDSLFTGESRLNHASGDSRTDFTCADNADFSCQHGWPPGQGFNCASA